MTTLWTSGRSAAVERLGTAGPPAVAELAADSRAVALWTLISRATGFARVAVVAAVLGPTWFGNLFQTAVLLPYLLHELLAGSLITAMLVPRLVRHLEAGDRAAARRLASGFLGTVVLLLAGIAALAVLAAPPLLALVTAAVDDPAVRQIQQALGGPLLAMLMPQAVLHGAAAIGVAVQQAHRRFALATLAPALENVAVTAVFGVAALRYGVGTDLEAIGVPQLLLLGLGSTAAVGLHAALQGWGAWRLGFALLPRAGWRDPEVRGLARLALPSIGYTVLLVVTHLALLVVAGHVPGGAVAFQIGWNLFNLPIALGARPVAAAQLRPLCRSFQAGALAAFHATYRAGLALTLFLVLPASFALVALPGSLARLVAFGGMGIEAGVTLVAVAVASLGAGLVGEAVLVVATAAAYARGDALSPLLAMALRAAIVLAGLGLALVVAADVGNGAVTDGAEILRILGLAVSAGTLVAAIFLHHRHRRALPAPVPVGSRFPSDLAAAAAAVAAGMAVAGAGPVGIGAAGPVPGSLVTDLLALTVTGAVYLLVQWARGSAELAVLLPFPAGHGRPAPPPRPVPAEPSP